MAVQTSLVKLGDSHNRIKRHNMEKDLYGGMGRGVDGVKEKRRGQSERNQNALYTGLTLSENTLKTIILQQQIIMCLVG